MATGQRGVGDLLARGALFVAVVAAVPAVGFYQAWNGASHEVDVHGREIYTSIRKSATTVPQVDVLILGDSTANQLYNNEQYDDAVYSLSCNQAITLAGQYVLLRNFLDNNHPDGLVVYLLFVPYSLSNNVLRWTTFHYFLKPLYRREYYRYYTDLVHDRTHDIPFWWLARFPPVRTSGWAPASSLNIGSPDDGPLAPISDISLDYLTKIQALADEHGFRLTMLAPPLNRAVYDDYDLVDLGRRMRSVGLERLFSQYSESIQLLPMAEFVDDHHYIPSALARWGSDPMGLAATLD